MTMELIVCHARGFSDWHKRFKSVKSGQEEVEDDPKPGRPATSKNAENIEMINTLVQRDRRLTARILEYELGMKKDTVRTILIEIGGRIIHGYFIMTIHPHTRLSVSGSSWPAIRLPASSTRLICQI